MRICSELVSEKFRAKLDAFSLVIRTYTCETLACVETIQHLDIFVLFTFYSNFGVVSFPQSPLPTGMNIAHR